jgi:NADP-dependent 3-hydroxy acid dehydrogenase YdfG
MSSRKAIAIIAGAGPGTGAAVARALARKGYAVALLARTPSKLADIESQITSEGGTAASFPTDLTQRSSLISAFTAISERFGPDAPVKVSHPALLHYAQRNPTNLHTTRLRS